MERKTFDELQREHIKFILEKRKEKDERLKRTGVGSIPIIELVGFTPEGRQIVLLSRTRLDDYTKAVGSLVNAILAEESTPAETPTLSVVPDGE